MQTTFTFNGEKFWTSRHLSKNKGVVVSCKTGRVYIANLILERMTFLCTDKEDYFNGKFKK